MAQPPPAQSLPADSFPARLAAAAPRLSPAARRVARFLEQNPPLALALSASELAARTATSDATVIRTVQALGFAGLPELKRALAAALAAPPPDPGEAMRRTLAEAGADAARAVDMVLETQREALEALAAPDSRATLRAAVAALHPARALDASGLALADQMLDLAPGDALLVLAYGRAYREVVALFAEARRIGLPLVLVTDSLDRSLARHADVVVPARRGRARRVALHGATLVALEAVALGLAAMDGPRALAALDRLNDLRAAIAGGRPDVG